MCHLRALNLRQAPQLTSVTLHALPGGPKGEARVEGRVGLSKHPPSSIFYLLSSIFYLPPPASRLTASPPAASSADRGVAVREPECRSALPELMGDPAFPGG